MKVLPLVQSVAANDVAVGHERSRSQHLFRKKGVVVVEAQAGVEREAVDRPFVLGEDGAFGQMAVPRIRCGAPLIRFGMALLNR